VKAKIDRETGSMLVLCICVACFILVPLLIVFTQLGSLMLFRSRTQSTVEAACLLAARDASRIIIDDPNFGYVSLSNYPPTGKGTCAEDGEPLPVVGINTLAATIRQNTIIASELDNGTMSSLVDGDRLCLDATIDELNSTLAGSLNGRSKNKVFDIDGEKVNPIEDVTAFLRSNLPFGTKIESLKLSSGWLSTGGGTAISAPLPLNLAQVKRDQLLRNEYKPFVDIPAAGQSFTFAGLGRSPSLSNILNFRDADEGHICSIIKIECSISMSSPLSCLLPWQHESNQALRFTACCQPYSNPDIGPLGVMALRFPQGPVPGLQSWKDLLDTSNFHDNQLSTYHVVGGDYPIDKDARMKQLETKANTGTAQQLAEALYCWLRNGHARCRIDSVIATIEDRFPPGAVGCFYIYEFARDGTISRRTLPRDPFPIGVTSDAQCSAIADTSTQAGSPTIIIFRNNVRHLGVRAGGKHAGQPLAGYPLNWCELQSFGGDDWLASLSDKGRLGTRLMMSTSSELPMAGSAISNLFRTFEGQLLCRQPRSSYYSGGLALDIEIGGTRKYNPQADVLSMRKFCRGRKI
jgi:hypothetical protein